METKTLVRISKWSPFLLYLSTLKPNMTKPDAKPVTKKGFQ